MNKVFVWTGYGLDSACSYLLLNWLTSDILDVAQTTTERFREDFLRWQLKTSLLEYKTVFITGLDLTRSLDVADRSNVVIIDHHPRHVEARNLYSTAQTVIANNTSTSRLIFKSFNSIFKDKLTTEQKQLVALVNDYTSGENKLQVSRDLNSLYWSYAGTKIIKFSEDFNKGFRAFNKLQQNAINFYNKKAQRDINQLDIYTGKITLKDGDHRVVSCFSISSYDEISNYLFNTHAAEIAVIINIQTKTVFFTRSKTSTVSMDKLANLLCDGSGTDRFAGGSLTDKFLTFCKTLEQLC